MRIKFCSLMLLLVFLCNTPSASSARQEQSEILNNIYASFLREDYEFVVSECSRYLNRGGSSKIEDELYYYKGLGLLKLYKWKDAEIVFRELIWQFPKSGLVEDAYMSLGDIYTLRGSYEDAERMYKDFLKNYSGSDYKSMVFLKLGNIKRKLGEWDKSRKYYDIVRKEYPQSLEAEMADDIMTEGVFYFTIQVGSFANLGNAQALTAKLKKKGYKVYITEAYSNDDQFYRVRVDKMNSREEAVWLESRLKKERLATRIYP